MPLNSASWTCGLGLMGLGGVEVCPVEVCPVEASGDCGYSQASTDTPPNSTVTSTPITVHLSPVEVCFRRSLKFFHLAEMAEPRLIREPPSQTSSRFRARLAFPSEPHMNSALIKPAEMHLCGGMASGTQRMTPTPRCRHVRSQNWSRTGCTPDETEARYRNEPGRRIRLHHRGSRQCG